MSIQEEIHKALSDVQRKAGRKEDLSEKDLEVLFLASLIEEEA